jgi:hypothetical protein
MKQLLIITLISILGFQGCATIVCGGSKQSIYVNSNPSGAKVIYHQPAKKNKEVVIEAGITPMIVEVKKKKAGFIEIQKEGYLTKSVELTKEVEAWFFGNCIFGGIIGFIIDMSTGGMWEIRPEKIDVQLEGVK